MDLTVLLTISAFVLGGAVFFLLAWIYTLKKSARTAELGIELGSNMQALMDTWEQHTSYMADRERQLENLLQGGLDGWWDWRIPEGVEYYSSRFREILGFEGTHDFPDVPESWQKYIDSDDLSRAFTCFEKHVASKGEVPYKLYVTYTKKSGEKIRVLCRGKVVDWDEDGSPLRMVGTHTDISDLDLEES